MSANPFAHGSGWIVFCGLALAALGLATQDGGQNPQDPTGGGGTRLLPVTPGYGTADSNGSMIAVTGIDVTGSSILYLIDTENRQLAVYQASGGSSSTMGLKFVAARNIDLDLQVWGYNDKSDLSYRDMVDEFKKKENNR